MNFAIAVLAGAFVTSSFIGVIDAIIESFLSQASREFNWLNPGDAARLLSVLSFISMMICIGIAGGQS